MGISNTSRTLEYIRSQGWIADKVEQFNPYAGKFGQRKDCFGIIDIIAMGELSIIGIQSCGQGFAEHNRKILESENAVKWLECGGRLMLIGWRKIKKKRGGALKIWSPRMHEYNLTDFNIKDMIPF
jgi:hypothetical protein